MPYLGDVRAMSFASVPEGWAPCRGQLLAIEQYRALFYLLGTTHGGDGRTTFALPDLPGVPVQGDAASGLELNHCICLHGDWPAQAGRGVEPGERRRAGVRTIDVYAGEVRAMPYDFVPAGWAPCDGRLLERAASEPLYDLFGATYGGDAFTTFALPKLPPLAARSGTLHHRIALDGVFFFVDANGANAFLVPEGEFRLSGSLAGETRIFTFDFYGTPGWLKCDGRLIAISEYESLFEAIGTTYGGDGRSTFALPNATGPDFEGKPLSRFISLGVQNYSIDAEAATDAAKAMLYDLVISNNKRSFGVRGGMPEEQAEAAIAALLRLYGARPGTKAHVEASAVLYEALKGMPGRPQ
jgi:microcystin-dependent protein